MATGVLKVRVGGTWIPIGASGSLPAHAAMHQPGGADALTVLDAGILTQGTLPDARLSPNVLKVTGGFPGGTVNFLRADGTFSPAGVGNITGPGSSVINDLAAFFDTTGKVLFDTGIPLGQVARLDSSPTFAGNLTANSLIASSSGWGSLTLTHTAGSVDKKNLQIYYANGLLVMRALTDNLGTQLGYASLDSSGNLAAAADITARGLVKIGAPDGSWPGMMFYNTYFTINHTSGGQLGWWHQSGVFNLNMGLLRFNSTLLTISNAGGSSLMTVRNDGTVTCPYYLVIPVGTDRWSPA